MAQKKEKGPRPVEIVIAAVLSLILGVLGAVVYLAFQPLEKVTEMPDEEEREFGRVYYVEGSEGDSSDDTWEPKAEAVSTGRSGSLSFVEEELNQWAAQNLDVERKAGNLNIEPGVPNFRIADGRFYAAVPLTWNLFGTSRTLDSYVSGKFSSQNGSHSLDYERLYVGGCPIPNVFGLANRLFRDVVESYEVSDELQEGWAALETVSIEDDALTLVIP